MEEESGELFRSLHMALGGLPLLTFAFTGPFGIPVSPQPPLPPPLTPGTRPPHSSGRHGISKLFARPSRDRAVRDEPSPGRFPWPTVVPAPIAMGQAALVTSGLGLRSHGRGSPP